MDSNANCCFADGHCSLAPDGPSRLAVHPIHHHQ
ncbi:hypothetical protein GNZ12_22535 [Paraburkholderia sp. 1N]|uniref:Uncharacterized protein n=1 Tax=Paraburkholderia solitsugae TaxID=2675748 RepID=A0ABX2BT15_9BURK|nr:hypothetical protein [Paraburkholderia solitsugae]